MSSNKPSENPVLRYDNHTGEPIIPEGYALKYDNQTGEAVLYKKRATRKAAKTAEAPDTAAAVETAAAAEAIAAANAPAAIPDVSAPVSAVPPAVSQSFPVYAAPKPNADASFAASSPYAFPAPQPLVQPAPPAPPLYADSRCVGFFRRLLAFAVDSLIAWLFTVLLSLIARFIGLGGLGFFTERIFFDFTAANVVGYLIIAAYFVIFTKCLGATPGKRLLRIKVVNSEPKPLSWWGVIYRETIGRYLTSLLFVGYLVLAIDSQHRGFHDMLADTRVIYE